MTALVDMSREEDLYWHPPILKRVIGHKYAGCYTYCPFCGTPILYARTSADDTQAPDKVFAYCLPGTHGEIPSRRFLIRGDVARYWGHAGGEFSRHLCPEKKTLQEANQSTRYVKLNVAQNLDLGLNKPASDGKRLDCVNDLFYRKFLARTDEREAYENGEQVDIPDPIFERRI